MDSIEFPIKAWVCFYLNSFHVLSYVAVKNNLRFTFKYQKQCPVAIDNTTTMAGHHQQQEWLLVANGKPLSLSLLDRIKTYGMTVSP